MTDTPDPIWETALDWLLLIQENPHDPELAGRLNHWRSSAAAHDAAYRKALKVWHLSAEALSLPAAPLPLTDQQPSSRRPASRLTRYKRPLISAAMAACALLVLLPDWQALQADFSSPIAEHRNVTLADGSHMQLDSNSLIDVQFGPQQREVTLLRGQAFFSVKADPDRAFFVNAGQVRVRVTGTAFAVSVADNAVEVSVESGTVAVQTAKPGAPSSHVLHRGDQLRYTLKDHGIHQAQLPAEQIAPWRRWQLVAIDQSVDDILVQLRRYQPGLVLLTDKALGERRITAALNLREPKRALQAAIAPLGGQVEDGVPYTLIVSAKP